MVSVIDTINRFECGSRFRSRNSEKCGRKKQETHFGEKKSIKKLEFTHICMFVHMIFISIYFSVFGILAHKYAPGKYCLDYVFVFPFAM